MLVSFSLFFASLFATVAPSSLDAPTLQNGGGGIIIDQPKSGDKKPN
jgi:hypothetical protein